MGKRAGIVTKKRHNDEDKMENQTINAIISQ